ncbi:hypothetical protein [Azospirillum humicireducens]|uniref:hypothetical protein n=1 Tax=Azospirillum humicireducens TaxID=1226968 RepID=UPI000B30012E|nr:hypothetical protein [Azospirillum humicireducens]
MRPIERARRLSRCLQARFRIDLFSTLVEREFERRLAEFILEAERDAYRRGREAALAGSGGSPVPVSGEDGKAAVNPSPQREEGAWPGGKPMTM